MKQPVLLAVVLSCCTSVFAGENPAAEQAYCKYIMEQATAQRDLLRSPSAIVGPTQPSAGTAKATLRTPNREIDIELSFDGSDTAHVKAPKHQFDVKLSCEDAEAAD